tara:strand:- start:116 stop:424 length:309 start_codon:yes stop_codon:yes gene_type:complete
MTGATLRDAGTDLVLSNLQDWVLISDVNFRFWLSHVAAAEFALEDFRQYAEGQGMAQPHHPNAWGAICKRFSHLIEPIGVQLSKRPMAHSRLTRTYRKTANV